MTEKTTRKETTPFPLALFPGAGVTEETDAPKNTFPSPLALFPRAGVTKETTDMDLQELCVSGLTHEPHADYEIVGSTVSSANALAPFLVE